MIDAEKPTKGVAKAEVELKRLFSRLSTGLVFGVIFVVSVCTSCSNDENSPLVKRTFERDRDSDGKIDLRVETHARGEVTVFRKIERRLKAGALSATRSYFVSGKTIVIEEDNDGDGLFETVVVFGATRNGLEIFFRLRDGTTAVAPSEVKETYLKMLSAVEGFWDKAEVAELWDKALSVGDKKAAEVLMEQTQEKISTAIRQIEELKKTPATTGNTPK